MQTRKTEILPELLVSAIKWAEEAVETATSEEIELATQNDGLWEVFKSKAMNEPFFETIEDSSSRDIVLEITATAYIGRMMIAHANENGASYGADEWNSWMLWRSTDKNKQLAALKQKIYLRAARLKKFLDIDAPDAIITKEKEMIKEAVRKYQQACVLKP